MRFSGIHGKEEKTGREGTLSELEYAIEDRSMPEDRQTLVREKKKGIVRNR